MVSDESNKWYGAPGIYDRFSQAEDPLCLSLDYALSLLPSTVKEIADLGTGTGRFALFIAERRPDIQTIFAVDASKEMHDYLTREIDFSPGLASRVRPTYGRNEKLPFPDASLDAVVSSWAFPSSIWNAERCLDEMKEVRRVLKPEGYLVTLGWDETFRDEMSELWYRFVPEPDYRRESVEEWRRRRRLRLHSPRNCHLTWAKKQLKVPLLFSSSTEAATTLGHLFGYSAGQWVTQQRRSEFSIFVGITCDDTASIESAIGTLEERMKPTGSGSE
jgi:ubiquinone/menaquinone biosynthesis C-methylase UbiE